ncbi:MAG TPA: hypothetical protein VGP07_06425 [Polyangia bacterium]|jgi:hypothetical protein
MTKTTMTTMVTMTMCALVALAGCGGPTADPTAGDGMMGSQDTGSQDTGSQGATGPKVPTQPTDEAAPTGTLDPQLVGVWPVTGVQVYWDGTSVPDWSASDPLQAQLASVALVLVADGTFAFGPVTGTWTVIPFLATDKALWGTGGRGPEGYPRELVLIVNGHVYTRGPIEDPSPPATTPWGLNAVFHVTTPQAGNVMLILERAATTTSPGSKK